jgi:UDP-N-acetylglucosamine 2-epimerase
VIILSIILFAIQSHGMGGCDSGLIPQLGYVDFIRLMSEARVVFTDSGGIQDETTMLGVPCITLEDTTERPITLKQGTNVLAGSNPEKIIREFNRARRKRNTVNRSPRYWDGKAANRIIKVLFDDFCSSRSIAAPDSGVEGDRQERSHSAAARSSHPGRFSSRL